MKILSRILVVSLLTLPAFAQVGGVGGISPSAFPVQSTVSALPTADGTQGIRIVTDGASSSDCSTGGGSTVVACIDTGSWTALGSGGGGGSQSLFETIDAPAGTDPVADSTTDTLTLAATSPLTITGDASTDTLTFAVTQNAGTDVTADLEEETHASEHSLGGGDAVTVTNLASGCTDAQVLGGTAAGTGVECQADDTGADSPAGAGSELQYRVDGSTFGAVTSSSVSGADVTFGGQLGLPYGTQATPSVGFPSGSGIFGEASGAAINITIAGTSAGFRFSNCTGLARCFGGRSSAAPLILDFAPTSSASPIRPRSTDSDTGLTSAGDNEIGFLAGGTYAFATTATATTLYVAQINTASVATCADSGDANPGTLAINPAGTSNVHVTNSDADGCNLSISETGAVANQAIEIEIVSTAGGTITMTDTPGGQNLEGNWTPGVGDSLTARYNSAASEWRERARADI